MMNLQEIWCECLGCTNLAQDIGHCWGLVNVIMNLHAKCLKRGQPSTLSAKTVIANIHTGQSSDLLSFQIRPQIHFICHVVVQITPINLKHILLGANAQSRPGRPCDRVYNCSLESVAIACTVRARTWDRKTRPISALFLQQTTINFLLFLSSFISFLLSFRYNIIPPLFISSLLSSTVLFRFYFLHFLAYFLLFFNPQFFISSYFFHLSSLTFSVLIFVKYSHGIITYLFIAYLTKPSVTESVVYASSYQIRDFQTLSARGDPWTSCTTL